MIAQHSDQGTADSGGLDDHLFARVRSGPVRVGYIASCPDPTREYFNERRDYYRRWNADLVHYIELEDGFDKKALKKVLECEIVHLSGGNTARFMHWAVRRDLGHHLSRFLHTGGAIVGVSAGSMILTPSIRLAIQDGEMFPDLESDTGLGIVPWEFYPHADHSSTCMTRLQSYAHLCPNPVYACEDGAGLLYDCETLKMFGRVTLVDGSETDPNRFPGPDP